MFCCFVVEFTIPHDADAKFLQSFDAFLEWIVNHFLNLLLSRNAASRAPQITTAIGKPIMMKITSPNMHKAFVICLPQYI
jgi:hypothetical protein